MSTGIRSENEETRAALGRYARRKGDETRTKILKLLRNQPMTHKQLLLKVGITASALSPHLKTLKEKELIEKVAKDGKVLYQTVSKETADEEFVNFIINVIRGLNMGDLYPEYEKIIREALLDDQKKRNKEIDDMLKKRGTSMEKIAEEVKKEKEKLNEI